MKHDCTFKKFDADRRIAYGIVYRPLVADTQGDWATAESIEQWAHDFSANNRAANIDVQHDLKPSGARVVESFIARKGDQDFPVGAWCMGIKCPENVWQLVKSGEINGLSMYGRGERIEKGLPDDPNAKYELVNGEIETVSLVQRAANKEDLVMTKSDTQSIGQVFENIAAAMQKQAKTLDAIAARIDKQNQSLTELSKLGTDDRGRLRKGAPVQRQDPQVAQLQRRRERLQARLEAVWEDPTQYPEVDEADLRRRLAKAEDRLHELGYQAPRADLESHSAFEIHGTSNFLQAGPSPLEDILGVRRNGIQKSDEDQISLNCLVL